MQVLPLRKWARLVRADRIRVFVYQKLLSTSAKWRSRAPPDRFCFSICVGFFSHFLPVSQETNCLFVVRWIYSQVCQVSDQTGAEECECSMSLIDGSDYQSLFVKDTRERILCFNGKSAFNSKFLKWNCPTQQNTAGAYLAKDRLLKVWTWIKVFNSKWNEIVAKSGHSILLWVLSRRCVRNFVTVSLDFREIL